MYRTYPFFRAFAKDEEGCIHPDEIKFVLKHLPGDLEMEEIEEMIEIVDKNKDGKISYSEFRVRLKNYERGVSNQKLF